MSVATMLPQLSEGEILSKFRVRSATSILASDPRLGGDQGSLHAIAVSIELAGLAREHGLKFVEWPDASLGVVYIADDAEERDCNLVTAYLVARHVLERLVLAGAACDHDPH